MDYRLPKLAGMKDFVTAHNELLTQQVKTQNVDLEWEPTS